MPVFGLFGHDFALNEGANSFTRIGPFPVTCAITLAAGAQRIDVALRGSVCGVDLILSFRASISIAGNRVHLAAPPAGVAGNRVVQYFSSTSGVDLQDPALRQHDDPAIGLCIVDFDEMAFAWLNQSSRLPPPVTVMDRGPGALLHLDVRTRQAVHRPGLPGDRPSLAWDDLFGAVHGPTPEQIGPRQSLRIDSLAFDGTRYEVVARPTAGALFLHADLLDTTRLRDGNEFLFQYAVANGRLRVEGDVEAAVPRVFWSRDSASRLPAIVLLRHQDEHGHPIALVPDAGTEIPIVYRVGVTTPVFEQNLPALWDQTNAAMVIGPHQDDTCTIAGQVRALDPLALYAAFADLRTAKNSLQQPAFLSGGNLPLSGVPLEIHGLSRGVWLRRRRGNALPARLQVDGLERSAPGHAFHHTSLVLADAADWTLESLTEERDVAQQNEATPRGVGTYSFAGKPGELSLPVVDLAFALSNLAGPTRLDPDGVQLGQGVLPQHGRDYLALHERQFAGETPTRFEVSTLERQRHVSGVRISPPELQPFARVLDALPTTVDGAAQTGRPGAALASNGSGASITASHRLAALAATSTTFHTKFTFGGEDAAGTEAALVGAATTARDTVTGPFAAFEQNWRGQAAHPLVRALRARLGIADRPGALTDMDQAAELLQAALSYVESSSNLQDIADDADALLQYLSGLSAEEFAEVWAAPSEPGFDQLLEHVWSPANNDLLRRITRLLRDAPEPALATLLFGQPDLSAVLAILDAPVAGLLTELQRGADAAWQAVVALWADGQDQLLNELRTKYGPVLSRDVYARLLEAANAADAAKLLEVIRSDLGLQLRKLGDLATDPPDYIFRTKRFPVQRSGAGDELAAALWHQCFDLCGFAAEKFWSFFLDDETSVVVKLTQKRTLAELLREIDAQYRSADRDDPLGLREPLNAFLDTLDADLLAADWTGALFLRPVADISRDAVLRDLAGFDHITASYIAVGGRKPDSTAWRPPAIDIWAHIFKKRDAGPELADDPSPVGDVRLALTKFDVRIRQTQLSDADIEIEIYPKDVWGRQRNFEKLVLHGRLEPPGSDPNAPRDLVFSAFFPKPFILEINLAFVQELALGALRVARRDGVTCIEIDGSLLLREQFEAGLDLRIDLGGDGRLQLQGFRIQLPPLPGRKVELGTLRKLGFDFPAVRFAIPNPRAFNVFGIEMVPRGLGYIRGGAQGAGAALERLKRDYLWLSRLDITGEMPGVFVSYVELDADFGKLPGFGLVDARGLRFRMALALKIVGGAAADTAYLGISGLDARDLRIDLFRLLTLEMDRLRISPAKLVPKGENPATHPINAGAILAEQIRLKLLNWSPVPERARFDLLLLHPTDDQPTAGRKGMLAVYDSQSTPDPGGSPAEDKFFQVFWAVLAHNLELPADALSHLLGSSLGNTEPIGLLQSLITKPPESTDPNDPRAELVLDGVRLLDRESWLFGLSFALGALFRRCNLVLHDQHYYGIHLWAEWVQAVFQQDSIELAYIPGPTRSSDRFRTNLRVPALDMLGAAKSGEVALEWAVNWDFLVDVGFPWRTGIGYDWFRSFSVPVGVYEGKFGFYFEKRTVAVSSGERLVLSAGLGLYVGYFFGAGNSVAWVRAGIGVFAIMQGTITFRAPGPILSPAILKASIESVEIVGVVGIFAYGEGGIDVWILSARFRVSAQAAVECRILYLAGGPCSLSYAATLSAAYSASVRVGCGFCSWTFSVSGAVQMGVSGQLLLS